MQIVPMRDLKDTVKIEKMCAETKSPVFITKNGYGRLVVMDIECYEKMFNQVCETKIINRGLEDVEKGKLINGDAVLGELKNKYGF